MNMFGSRDQHIDLGGWTELELGRLIREASQIDDPGLRIAFISGFFLGLKYRESTLIGSSDTAEIFVTDLSGVDCFTFIDYVEAMRLSDSYEGFLEKLVQGRYRNSVVAYESRRHFFTDWVEHAPAFVDDITEHIGGGKTKSLIKMMNLKEDGSPLLQGIGSSQRTITYIPPENIDEAVLQRLKTGDYTGIVSTMQGLDVSHVGIIIKDEGAARLRHASSDNNFRKVVDQDLLAYISGKPGLIILRPKDQ